MPWKVKRNVLVTQILKGHYRQIMGEKLRVYFLETYVHVRAKHIFILFFLKIKTGMVSNPK